MSLRIDDNKLLKNIELFGLRLKSWTLYQFMIDI